MKMIASMLIISHISGCSWLNDYGHCTASWRCDSCEDVTVEFQWVKHLDEKEAELP
jgi:hypothetical protein